MLTINKSKSKSSLSSKKILKSTKINNNNQNLTNTENNSPNISNNQNKLFDLHVFRKIKSNNYNNQEKCKSNDKKWGINYQTNPKFEKFDQKYYTAGDFNDFDKYGILSSLYYLSDESKTINKNIPNKNINAKKICKLYKNIDIVSIINTFTYIFYKFKKGIFIIIHNNQLALFLPFSNANYINNWYDKIYFSLEEKKLLEENDYDKIQHILTKNARDFSQKYYDQFKARGLEFNRKKWVGNGCYFQNSYRSYEGEHDIDVFKTFIEELCKHRSIPNVQFFLNYRDFPILKKDLTEPYEHLFDSDKVPIEKKYAFSKFCPIFSQSTTDNYADLLIPTSDEWIMHSGKFFSGCSNSYQESQFKNMVHDWTKKKEMVVFRGSATQCGSTIDSNQRLKAAQLGYEYPKILDVGITSWKERMKKYKGEEMKIIDKNKFHFDVVQPLTRQQQSEYKYILHIPGYVGAFRLASEFRMHSVILIVNSEHKLWFTHLLVPYEHFIPVKNDLSDLLDITKWCIKNDKKCKKIAENSYHFYQKYLTKNGLFDYMQTTLTQIYLNRNLKNPLNIKKTKKNIAVISLFRPQKETNRESQRKLFIQYMNRVLPKYCNYHIYIIEQSQDGEKFCIAKLKNIGFEISSKKDKYDAFLFTDIDHLFDYDLLPYCVQKPKYPMCLAYNGTRYRKNNELDKFFGGTNIFSEKDFKKINGYSINYHGWGYEDRSLLLRVHLSGINNIQYPKIGQVVDTEMTLNYKPVELIAKTKQPKNIAETTGYEKVLLEPTYWKKNGLNNLDYKIIKTTQINISTTQIKVDLLIKQDKKKYPYLFPVPNNMNNYQFEQFKKKYKTTIHDYLEKIKVNFV